MDQQRGESALAQLTSLLDGAHLATPDSLPAVITSAAAVLDWSARVYLIDYTQRWLVALPVTSDPAPDREEVDSTLAGLAFRSVEPIPIGADDGPGVWVPLLDGVERLGVIQFRFPLGTDVDSGPLREQFRWFAHLAGHLIAAKSPYGDNFHRVRSSGRRSVASELVWSLLPPLTMACDAVVISALLEPAEQVAGDVFDYAIQGDVAHVAIFDATGHDLHSSVIGALTLAAYRNGRRHDSDLASIAVTIDSTLIQYGLDTHATGVIGELQLSTGVFRFVNAGHLSPLLVRGGKVVKSLDGGRRILLGFPDRSSEPVEEHLEPGDVIVLYTDGIVEARDEDRRFFGLDRFVDILERSAAERRQAPETLRRIVHRVLEYQKGSLQDDASVLIIEWNGANANANATATANSSSAG